jgi:cytochrome c oxidase subunit II
VKLANGQTLVADDAYLLESILAPDAKIVDGFPRGSMSARIPAGSVTTAQAKAIIAYIKTLK